MAPLTICDISGDQFTAMPRVAAALRQCDTFREHSNFSDEFDFSQTGRSFCNTKTLLKLARVIENENSYFTEGKSKDEGQLLELANYVYAPTTIARFLAQQLWADFEEKKSDEPEVKFRKESLRRIARQYVATPFNLLALVKSVENSRWFFLEQSHSVSYSYRTDTLNFSHAHCQRFIDQYALQTNDSYMIKTFGFTGFDGLKELIAHVTQTSVVSSWEYKGLTRINLSGHSLQTVNLNQIQAAIAKEDQWDYLAHKGFSSINLSRNLITSLDASHFETEYEKPDELNLSNNSIVRIDDTVFRLLNRWRAYNRVIRLNLKDNCLLKEEKAIEKAYYKATHTLPERYLTFSKYYLAFFITTYAVMLAANHASDTFSPIPALLIGGLTSGTVTLAEFITGFWLLRLAKIGHPSICCPMDPLRREQTVWRSPHWNQPEIRL